MERPSNVPLFLYEVISQLKCNINVKIFVEFTVLGKAKAVEELHDGSFVFELESRIYQIKGLFEVKRFCYIKLTSDKASATGKVIVA